jgi:hypothetical protein
MANRIIRTPLISQRPGFASLLLPSLSEFRQAAPGLINLRKCPVFVAINPITLGKSSTVIPLAVSCFSE